MEIAELFSRWEKLAVEDLDVKRELESLRGPGKEAELQDRFYRDLEFGTGGLRGVIGAGSNRMNIYTIRKATQGLANYLLRTEKKPSAAIAYDSRIKSDIFAKEAACVLAANGVTAHLYPRLEPTPALSFAVRELRCSAGICITASHNPAKYNGYKVYGSDGCQITLKAAEEILDEIKKVDVFEDVKTEGFDAAVSSGRIQMITEEVLSAFLDAVLRQRIRKTPCDGLSVVYTPLNGAGRECVTRMLEKIGVTGVTVVPEQEMPDGNFPTCPYPNPEIREALQKGLKLCEKVCPDLLLATDPDCDRVGIAVREGDFYTLLSGNETGVLLLNYIAEKRTESKTMPARPVAVKTIVTTDMANDIAREYGIELRETLTGFKYIGEQIGLLEKAGEISRYLFGFEESYGYLSGGHVRDKDAVNASMLICDMAADYKERGMTLCEALQNLYNRYGWYRNRLCSAEFEGADGMRQMEQFMETLRKCPPETLAGLSVTSSTDYSVPVPPLPASNVLEYRMEGGAKLIVRPSGTEPKLKLYLSVRGKSRQDADLLLDKLEQAATQLLPEKGE